MRHSSKGDIHVGYHTRQARNLDGRWIQRTGSAILNSNGSWICYTPVRVEKR